MRKVLVACAILFVASAGVSSQSSDLYVGLFADDAHSVWSVNYEGATKQFELWIWWLPSERGLNVTIFRLTYPSNLIAGNITVNPITEVLLGCNDGHEPMCATFLECQLGWVWTHHQTCMLTDALPSLIEIGPAGVNTLQASNCELGHPAEPITILNKFALNQGAVIAVEPQSWGAIKSLYR